MRFLAIIALFAWALPASAEQRPIEPATSHSTNAEMTAIFDADQKARAASKIDWAEVAVQDEARRRNTQVLLDAGELRSGDDFYHAASVFQHGDLLEDFLKAHAFALIATARGKP